MWDIDNIIRPYKTPEEIHKIRNHSHSVTSLAMSTGNTLYSGGRSVKVWDLDSTPLEMKACLRKHMSSVKEIVLNEGEGLIYSAGCGIKVKLFKYLRYSMFYDIVCM